MSATLDSHLFANYFGGAPALAAGGRTFPVEHFYLEDAHELIGYHLDAESNVAMRPNRDARSRKQLEAAAGGRDRQGLLRVPTSAAAILPPDLLLLWLFAYDGLAGSVQLTSRLAAHSDLLIKLSENMLALPCIQLCACSRNAGSMDLTSQGLCHNNAL